MAHSQMGTGEGGRRGKVMREGGGEGTGEDEGGEP